MEELELAASVASRRASAAEGQLHHVKQQLELADKRAKELAWQVCTSHGQYRGIITCLSRTMHKTVSWAGFPMVKGHWVSVGCRRVQHTARV